MEKWQTKTWSYRTTPDGLVFVCLFSSLSNKLPRQLFRWRFRSKGRSRLFIRRSVMKNARYARETEERWAEEGKELFT